VFNGMSIGVAFGSLARSGQGMNLWTFVCGHGAWELTAIVVSGAAGLRLGWSMIETGGRSRLGSMRAAAPGLYRLIVGAVAMMFVAASIEGFWSASPVPAEVKWGFGVVQAVIVSVWLLFGGRGEDP
jgi:uncharacterized membrane protein SpoIIM required for sporulation